MSRFAVALDLGGTRVRGALVDDQGAIHARTEQPTDVAAGGEAVIDQLVAAARVVAAGVSPRHLVGVGVSSPGPLDTETGVTLGLPSIGGFVDVPLRDRLAEALGQPVTLENDGIAAAVGEWRHGAGVGLQHLVYVTVSTGIGGGVIVDGRVMRGRRGMAGHVGHFVMVKDGNRCNCGNPGCWEAYGAGLAFEKRARQRVAAAPSSRLATASPLDARAVFAAAEAGDPLALALVAEEADILGVGMVSLLHLYSPQRIIVGGGLSNGFDRLLPGIMTRIASDAMPAFRDVTVVRAALAGNSGLVGAAALAFEAA